MRKIPCKYWNEAYEIPYLKCLKTAAEKVYQTDIYNVKAPGSEIGLSLFMYFRTNTPYNVTLEELEVRVERLEEDMFLAQADIIDNQGSINSLEFSLQETIETVV